MIGCESCHGGGAVHYGMGDIPRPNPGPKVCGKCHNRDFPGDHLTYHPNGGGIVEDYLKSPHAQSINKKVLVAGTPSTVKTECGRCHTDEGFRAYANAIPGTAGRDDMDAYFKNMPAKIKNASNVQCRTCHNPHKTNKDQLEALDGSTVAGAWQSAQYNTCTACHQINGADGLALSGSTAGSFHDPEADPKYGDTTRMLLANHAGVPGDTRLNTGANAQALYFVKKGDPNACAGCHNPHSADLTVNKQYAESGHGDPLGTAWTHYDWKGSSRQACQRCHTSTGAKNFAEAMKAGTVYNAALNDFSYLLAPDSDSTNDQNEALYCWACHTDYKGGLRNPPAFTKAYGAYKAMDGNTVTFPDLSGSNVCMNCHTGRGGGGDIANSTGNFTNLSMITSHHAVAGGVLTTKIGYQFAGRDYTNAAYYEHDLIGLPAAGNTVNAKMGTNGPCVACHMHGNSEKHLFSPVTKDGETVTAITNKGCAVCHSGAHPLTPEDLNTEKEDFNASISALKDQLNLKGFCRSGQGFNTVASGCVTAVKNWTNGVAANGKPNMGAAFDELTLESDAGAFVHNRIYTKRMIYDAIDWLDDYNLNGSVYGTLNALNAVTYPYKDQAMAYLLISNTNTTADRL